MRGISCSPINSTDEREYKEICFQKDLAYSIPFINDNKHFALAADFTTPLSWIKGTQCQVDGIAQKCHRITETIAERFRDSQKSKSKLHMMASESGLENSVIYGSSEIIRGEF